MRHLGVIVLALGLSACGRSPEPLHVGLPKAPPTVTTLTFVGQFSIPPLTRFPLVTDPLFGGLSGLTAGTSGRELFGVSDAQMGGRIYELSFEGFGETVRVTPTRFIPLAIAPGNIPPDDEALARLPNGNFLVAAEGTAREPRRPPSIMEYGRTGDFVRALTVRDRYVPEVTGPVTHGARGNAGFESLALTGDATRLFTATETSLFQDGEPANFEAGTKARLLEYVRRHDTYEPAREFVYEIERLEKPSFTPGFSIAGLVELLAIDRSTLLALERGYVEDSAKPGFGVNRIRIYRVSLDGATDVSRMESLKDRPRISPAAKTLVLDLSRTAGLSPDLAPSLDNFEGMAFGPRLPDGRASLVLVSDDNFSLAQRTWFLVFAIE